MKINTLTLGQLSVNCYIIEFKKMNIIIDPGAELQAIVRFIESNELDPDFIVNTHGHFDHIGAVQGLVEKYKIPFYIDSAEEEILSDPDKNGSSFPLKKFLRGVSTRGVSSPSK